MLKKLRFIYQNIISMKQILHHLTMSNLHLLQPVFFWLLLTITVLQSLQEKKPVWSLAMGSLLILVSLQPGGENEICWKGPRKPTVCQESRLFSTVPKMRHPQEVYLQGTWHFLWCLHADGNIHSQGSTTWIQRRHVQMSHSGSPYSQRRTNKYFQRHGPFDLS